MQMKSTVLVMGFKRWKGDIQDNQTNRTNAIDSGKLYVQVNLATRRNNADAWSGGFTCEEIKLPNGDFCKQLEHVQLPAEVELLIERESNGKESRDVVIGARLMAQQAPAAAKPVKAA